MDIVLIKTAQGMKPAYDEDYEKYSKLKIGEAYKTKVTKMRNYEFHKKYFALINCAWEFQNEKRQTFFMESVDKFRKAVEMSAGHCDTEYSIARKEWVDVPKSIAFDKMDGFEFDELYGRVKDVLFMIFLNHVSAEDFEKHLINF
jgi:hypothetical protein